ncbi:MAG: hypothetical protein K8R53_12495, partial [Bacteroidales bacterium]|nr:hypothetical protein [Bacteroidales bacterium]
MKKQVLFILFALMFFGLNASNIYVSGTIFSNTTWTGVDTVKVKAITRRHDSMKLEDDIRWVQRFDNYQRALVQLTKFIDKGELNELEEQGLIQ